MDVWLGDELVVLRDIPANVCVECKEPSFSPEISRRLDRFLEKRHHLEPEQYLSVPQYSVAQVLGEV